MCILLDTEKTETKSNFDSKLEAVQMDTERLNQLNADNFQTKQLTSKHSNNVGRKELGVHVQARGLFWINVGGSPDDLRKAKCF